MQHYVKTQSELADALDVSYKNLKAHWLGKSGWPEKERKGWPVDKCLEFMRAYKTATPGVGGRAGPDGDLKRTKLQREIEMLDVKIAILKGDYIPLDEHNAEIDECVTFFITGLEQWVQKVGSERRDAELLEWAQEIQDRTRAVLEAKANAHSNVETDSQPA